MKDERRVQDVPVLPPKVGVGRSTGHHGEFLQGVFRDSVQHLQRGLLTVPCPIYQSHATFWPRSQGPVTSRPAWCTKAVKAAELTLKLVNASNIGGDLTIDSNIPPGAGFGSSTADVIAAIRAVADFADLALSRMAVSRIAVEAEIASDSLAFGDQPVLFGHRSGVLIETFNGDYPRVTIVGFSTGDPPIATNDFVSARYSSGEVESFSILRALVSRAVSSNDAAALGRVSSVSANMNQRHLPISRFVEIEKLAQISRALGVQIAHSGNVAGFIFHSGDQYTIDMAAALLSKEGFTGIVKFATSSIAGGWH